MALLALAGIERLRGAHRPDLYFVEPRPILWEEDDRLGFRNRPHLVHTIFGNLTARTNGAGFRADEETPERAPEGVLRVFGLGDSVMWGTRTEVPDTFLALIADGLRAGGREVEAVNAGVVGFSAWQVRLLFEEPVLRYAPDLVLVNLHTNDYLPTEDPFGNVRSVYRAFLAAQGPPEPALASRLRRLLDAPKSWHALRRAIRDPRIQRGMRELLIDVPIREMVALARASDVRLVFLLIPPTFELPADRALRVQVASLLDELGVESVDLSGVLEPGTWKPEQGAEAGGPVAWLEAAGVPRLLEALSLARLDPVPRLRNLARLKGIRTAQEAADYIDRVGHPSRRGHRKIAEAVLAHLARSGR